MPKLNLFFITNLTYNYDGISHCDMQYEFDNKSTIFKINPFDLLLQNKDIIVKRSSSIKNISFAICHIMCSVLLIEYNELTFGSKLNLLPKVNSLFKSGFFSLSF